MKKVEIILAHPNMEESVINKALINEAKNLENVVVNDLYKKYRDFQIDVEAEQKLLLENDVIIFQFPFYWFSSPAIIKEWFDTVLTENFAYGDNGKLKGKTFVVATSAGGSEAQYQEISVGEFLNPFKGTAFYTQMEYRDPFIVYETYVLSKEQINETAKSYTDFIKDLS